MNGKWFENPLYSIDNLKIAKKLNFTLNDFPKENTLYHFFLFWLQSLQFSFFSNTSENGSYGNFASPLTLSENFIWPSTNYKRNTFWVLLTKCGLQNLCSRPENSYVWSLEEVNIFVVWLDRFAPFTK